MLCYKIYSNHKEKIMAAIRTILSPLRIKLKKSGYVGKVDDEEEADDEEVCTCAGKVTSKRALVSLARIHISIHK